MTDHIVVIGSGQAAIQLAHCLRSKHYDGDITLIGSEPYPAYQRPPLSKGYLKGELDEARLYLKPSAFYETKNVGLISQTRVTAIDRAAQQVCCDDGSIIAYDRLVIASGARPRTLPALEGLENVMLMRTIDDAKNLQGKLRGVKHMAVLGGGYIGLETAAVVRRMGIEVTVLEMMPRLLARVTSEPVARYFEQLHSDNGVEVLCGASVDSFLSDKGLLTGLKLDDSRTLETDLLLAGIGVLPNMELAQQAGIHCDNGIVVDQDGLSSDPKIYAIGDCAMRPLAGQAQKLRLESVASALEMAEIVACHIGGQERPAFEPPWFWSDQYDTTIQTVGLFSAYDDALIRGDIESGRFSVFYFNNEKFLAVDAVNDPKTFMACKQLFKKGIALRQADLQNESETMMDTYRRLCHGSA